MFQISVCMPPHTCHSVMKALKMLSCSSGLNRSYQFFFKYMICTEAYRGLIESSVTWCKDTHSSSRSSVLMSTYSIIPLQIERLPQRRTSEFCVNNSVWLQMCRKAFVQNIWMSEWSSPLKFLTYGWKGFVCEVTLTLTFDHHNLIWQNLSSIIICAKFEVIPLRRKNE